MAEKDFSKLLYSAVMTLKSEEECQHLFEDLCTPKEIKSIAQRFAVAKMLGEGRIYNDIVDETGASTATISRVNRTMSKGSKTVLERLRTNNN
ncbi:MAG: TrpR-like protein [Ruminococcaceae bacterium]|nr:TrpR-like protein [Oscillospiraceae bacterium]